jgi:hypothetical protein
MLCELNKIRVEFQTIFDNFYLHKSTVGVKGINTETKTELMKKFIEAGNKLKTNQPFKIIEETIIFEIRNELKMENFK